VTLEIEWIATLTRFAELAPEWSAILPDDATPFDLHPWYLAWWRAFAGDAELALCTARRDGELAGVFPLARSNGDIRALANVHTPSFRPLARDQETLDRLVEAAIENGGSRGFELVALPQDDPSVARLTAGAQDASLLSLIEPAYASPTVETVGDVERWRAESKRRWGAPLERFRRKMGREYDTDFAIVVAPDDLEAELDDGFRVEASGWKGQAGTAIVSDPATESFYREISQAFEQRGELRLSRIGLDGRTVAFDLCILHDGRLYLLKTGFDEDFRRLAPGLVMRLSIIERCFELSLRSHELLGGESEWKAKFETGKRPHVNLRTFRRSPPGLARYTYRTKLRPRLKRAYRRIKRVEP
jgi:CelD/BcsL family acetyltransferase involved in cellulose biosynthesis